MDKDIITGNHNITIGQRKSINITGVKKIENFDKLHFLLDTTMGFLVIKGNDLELIKLDTLSGNLTIKGSIDSLDYILENKKNNKEESILSRLFK